MAISRPKLRAVDHPGSSIVDTSGTPRRWYLDARGRYRIFNTAGYRFYRTKGAAPRETDTPFATNATLPFEPADLYGDGAWFLSASYFNGVLDSGFLPLGPNGETFLRLELSGGVEVNAPPEAPRDWRLQNRGAGVIRVLAFYMQIGSLRATQWAITYTTDGSEPAEPPAAAPTATQAMTDRGVAVLAFDLPAQVDGTGVKVRVQTRRLNGASWVYSEGSVVKTKTASANGGIAGSGGLGAYTWPGRLPEYL